MGNQRQTLNRAASIIEPDIHFGEHDESAVACIEKAAEWIKPWRWLQQGDALECRPFSSHPAYKISQAGDYDWHHHEVGPYLTHLRNLAKYNSPRMKYIQLEGNHEFRVERWCLGAGAVGSALWSTVNPESLIRHASPFKDTEYVRYIDDGDITSRYHLGPNLIVVHGWSFAVNAAQIHLQKAAIQGWSILFGHTHRAQLSTVRQSGTDRLMRAESFGCLRTLDPPFAQGKGPSGWSHGFGLMYQSRRDPLDYVIYHVPICKGRAILPDGHEISV